MGPQQIFVALLYTFLVSQQIAAVVNNGQSTKAEDSTKTTTNTESSESTNSIESSVKEQDLVAAGTEEESNRREAPSSLGDTYGPPLPVAADTYLPTGPTNVNLPVPVYGVPDAPSNNVVYPAPPPDIPPPVAVPALPAIPSGTYGLPQQVIAIPKPLYGPPAINNFISPHPPSKYGPPSLSPPPKFFPGPIKGPKYPKPVYGPPRPQYGPPKPLFTQKLPKPYTGKGSFYRPPKPLNTYGPPISLNIPYKDNYSPLKVNLNLNNANFLSSSFSHSSHSHSSQALSTQYGLPDLGIPHVHYGPPQPVANPRPPHPGAPAPPTPPDIKYDGWQPIPGLVSKIPSDSYGLPPTGHHAVGDLSYNNDLSPPPLGHGGLALSSSHTSSSGHGGVGVDISTLSLSSSGGHAGIKDSYGAPLNTVTGSGGVVSSSGEATAQHTDHSNSLSLGLAAVGIGQDSSVQAIKSIGYEISAGGGVNQITGGGSDVSHSVGHIGGAGDSYSAPPLNAYSPDGPYAAAHSHNLHGGSSSFLSSHSSNRHQGLSLSSSGIGLIPPSGLYGIPPSGQYGTPLFNTPRGSPLNALKINPPKRPVIFREPVPHGVFDSIVKQNGHSFDSSASTYLPPPVPDVSLSVKSEQPPAPSNLYSLPSATSAVSFQNIVHGSSGSGLTSDQFNHNIHINGASAAALTSYNIPLGIVDGTYSLPTISAPGDSSSLSVGLDHSHPPVTIDLTGGYAQTLQKFQSIPHDCSAHNSQPLPSLSYGVPSANTYTASLQSLTTNIGGGSVPSLAYGVPDLSAAHSQPVSSGSSLNYIEEAPQGKSYGKSVAESFGPGGELIESQSIDLKNIPVQGALGSYTLQIQPADGGIPGQVPHAQVLNDGLLQSIIAAIEQPQQNEQSVIGQIQPSFQGYFVNDTQDTRPVIDPVQDAETQQSVNSEVVLVPSATEAIEPRDNQQKEIETESSVPLIDNNEIALYFNNNPRRLKKDNADEEASEDEPSEVIRNGH